MNNNLFYIDLSKIFNTKTSERLKLTRELLAASINRVAKASGIAFNKIDRLEKQENIPSVETVLSLIFFYGFTLREFFDFEKPLPSAEKIKSKLIKFHKDHGSDAYLELFRDPALIELLEEELIPSGYFKTWRNVNEVQEYCWNTHKYRYLSATGTLNAAVKKEWLIKDEKSSPMQYKQGPKAPSKA